MPVKSSSSKKRLTRRQVRDLDITIHFLEGVVRRDPQYVEALQLLGDDYTLRGRYKAGLKIDKQLARLQPKDPLVHYNLACSYSLTGQLDDAIAALDRAITLGYRDFYWLARDPDLKQVRLHPLYVRIQAKVRKLKVQVH